MECESMELGQHLRLSRISPAVIGKGTSLSGSRRCESGGQFPK